MIRFSRTGILAVFIVPILGMLVSACDRSTSLQRHSRESTLNGNDPLPEARKGEIRSTPMSRIRITPRTASASFLDSIFGPSVEPAVTALIRGRVNEFGGPCDRYMIRRGTDGSVINECGQTRGFLSNYANSTESQATVLPSASTGREALRTRACEVIAATDAAIQFAARRAGASPNLSDPDGAGIRKAFGLFYPGQVIPSELELALAEVVKETRKAPNSQPLDGWRFLFLTLCLTTGWQVM